MRPSDETLQRLRAAFSYDSATGEFRHLTPGNPNWRGKIAGAIDSKGHRRLAFWKRRRCTSFAAHNVAWFLFYGEWPELVDHINRDPADNRIANLRLCTASQNTCNRTHRKRQSGIHGVTQSNGRFMARIFFNRQRHYLGMFETEVQAADAYNRAARSLHGEFASLNHLSTEAL